MYNIELYTYLKYCFFLSTVHFRYFVPKISVNQQYTALN